MSFRELYARDLDRKVNPAVSASDLNRETVMTEITEYVFTEEIIANLYKVLLNIKKNQGSHVGIWINGYFGSGKSHFLKYANYCLSREYAELAFKRLIDEAQKYLLDKDNDNLTLEQAGVSMSELKALQDWYINKAEVEMIMFNIGEVHNVNSEQTTAFTTIFWNRFNKMRGYDSSNLALAQHLEKLLDENGKFEEFKDYVKSKGFDWEKDKSRLAVGRLDMTLQMAKEVDNSLSIDAIRQKIINNDINVSVESFAKELKEHLDRKGNSHHRILFFVDEVSQFICEHPNLLLQLQSLVEHLYETCNSQVWIACTSQETLEDVVTNVGGNAKNPNDEIGKILGRFEVRASLQVTNPEYITQRRLLDKNNTVKDALSQMFEKEKSKLDAQFILPSTYYSYRNADEFVDYYPFVPYQFHLIMKVLESFVNMGYVNKEFRGTERSLLNITFSIAKETADWEIGQFIPFDLFYGVMFQGSIQNLGKLAFDNARRALKILNDDKEQQSFCMRVAYVLFMICNLSEVDKQSFSATTDNIVTLLMEKVDENRAVMKDKVNMALEFLEDKSVIHKVKKDNGTEIYEFYTQEESQIAQLIINTQVDSDTYSDELYKLIYPYFNLGNKVTYATRNFSVCYIVDGRSKLSNNADLLVDFMIFTYAESPEMLAFKNTRNHLVFFLNFLFSEDKKLYKKFDYFCKLQQFLHNDSVSSINREKIKRMFQDSAKTIYDKEIKPALQEILDTCPIIAGQSVLTPTEIGYSKGKERYQKALDCHLGILYESAQLVNNSETPKNANELRDKILRPVENTLIETPLSIAEERMNDYLNKQIRDITVEEIVSNFEKPPYGWNEIATIYILNELVRRHLYDYNYNNNPNVSRNVVATNLLKEKKRFTIERAKVIPQSVINDFIGAWKYIFNVISVPGSNDPNELYRNCKELDNSVLKTSKKEYSELSIRLGSCPCVSDIDEAVKLLDEWSAIRSQEDFFTTIIAAKETAKTLFDRCKDIAAFENKQYDKYEEIIQFLKDNDDNFSFLTDNQKSLAKQLEVIKIDTKPWEHLRKYYQLMKSLNDLLQECRTKLEDKIKENYDIVYNNLENYAKSVNISTNILDDRQTTIQSKCVSKNFYTLQANADTSAFCSEQTDKINKAINNIDISRTERTADENETKNNILTQIRICKKIQLNTHTFLPLRTEADVNEYLKKLKAEIMLHIDDNNDIIIL